MNISHLEIAGLRAFKHAEFDFRPGMNLLVGVNGVGKTTVLDGLRVCLSRVLPHITPSPSRPLAFETADIAGSLPSLTVTVSLQFGRETFEYSRHQQRENAIATDPKRIAAQARALVDERLKPGRLRKKTRELIETYGTPDRDTFLPDLTALKAAAVATDAHPFALFFSTRRSLVSDSTASVASAAGGVAGAFADALVSRELRLADLALWLRAQEAQGNEYPLALNHVAALRRAASRFLPECKNLHADAHPRPTLFVEKRGNRLDVRQLSDGERGLLAITLDLARRLSQANPALSDPVAKGRAVVLIDELDLHLHPRWQRTIVERLTHTFRGCQFIATTHSPQIVAAVEPEQVLLLTENGVVRPDRTLGMDSNWILRFLMEADDRPAGASKAIKGVEGLIRAGEFKKARTAMAAERKRGFELPEWSVLEARMARMEVLAK